MTIAELTREDEIAAAAIRGDEEAFAAVYDALSVRVFNFVLRSVHERSIAEDICQEVWIKAHREIRTLKAPQALRTWLFRMASRACIDYSRSKAYRDRGNPEITDEMLDPGTDEPEVAAMRRDEIRVMWEALAALPARQSMALYLKQVDGCSYEQIGRILGCPKTAVETLLFRARHGLVRTRERLQADPTASCKMIGATMSVVLDKEGTPIQERAVQAHLSDCRTCRDEVGGMKRGMAGYAWLPMLPVGGQALSAALLGGAAGTGAGIGISRLIGLLVINGKASGMAVAAIGALAAASVAGAAGLTPSPLDAFGLVQDMGTAVRNATIGGGDEDASAALKDDAEFDLQAPLERLQNEPASALPPAAPLDDTLDPPTPAGQLDPGAALSGLPGLLETASEGVVSAAEPLLTFVGDTLGGALEDPLATLQRLLSDPGGTVDALAGDVTEALNQTTQNTTTTIDDTVDQTTDVVDGLLGENELTDPLDETVDNTTDVVDETVGDVTDTVNETTDGLDETLDDVLGDDGPLGGDDGLLGGDGGSSEEDTGGDGGDGGLLDDLLGGGGGGDEEPPPEEEPPCIPLPLLPC